MPKKITGLTAIAVLSDEDLFEAVDDPGGTPLSRKASLTQLNAWLKTKPFLTDAGLPFIIDGGGSVILPGIQGDILVPFACTIDEIWMLADQSGSIVVDIWKDTYGNFPPVDGDSITASAVPTITTALKSNDATLTGWNTTIAKDDILRFNVDSVTSITRLSLILGLTKT